MDLNLDRDLDPDRKINDLEKEWNMDPALPKGYSRTGWTGFGIDSRKDAENAKDGEIRKGYELGSDEVQGFSGSRK